MTNPSSQILTIRSIPASETYTLRHAVLWPHKPLSYVQLPDDADGQHFGAFISATAADTTGSGGKHGGGEKTIGEARANDKDRDESSSSEPVSIISLFIAEGGDGEKQARFRKFATAASSQGKGIGSALLAHTIEAAARAGAKTIWCDARQSALPFYRRFGMDAAGEVFFKGDVPYLRMSKRLSD
ncbi:hypothetical protein SLS62_008471 [Diatrype stigma]|uniref:N-acetyltransferase domain-containing protein n=1 Tax=Diatrype stigma TaxID=117547 RepID=A0AAN9YLX6_9PEZI